VADALDYRGGELRHTPGQDDEIRAWQALVEFANALAAQYGTLWSSLDEDGKISQARQAALVQDLHAQLFRHYKLTVDLGHHHGQLADDERQQHDAERQQWAMERNKQEAERKRQDAERQHWHHERQQWDAERQRWQSKQQQWNADLVHWDAERQHLRWAQEQRNRLFEALQAAHQSWTWKVGRSALGPLIWLCGLWRVHSRTAKGMISGRKKSPAGRTKANSESLPHATWTDRCHDPADVQGK
jgi:hypothetical protein